MRYRLHLTHITAGRKVVEKRVRLTLFSAPLESPRLPEVHNSVTRKLSRPHRISTNAEDAVEIEWARLALLIHNATATAGKGIREV